jgi:hypothetical protein
MKTWNELMHSKNTEEERLIIQLLATATTQPTYSRMTPDEVYDLHVQWMKEVGDYDSKALSDIDVACL